MLLVAIFITMAVVSAIGTSVLILRNKDLFFPKQQKN